MAPNREVPILLTSVFIIAVCGILYELLLSTVSTYFLGSSILHFSVTIGLFLSAMGLGSFLSRFITNHLLDNFVKIELWLGLMGGLSALILQASFSFTENYYLTAFVLITILGTFIGIEIPLLTRILKKYDNLKDTISNVLAFDYIGSLVASVIFPLLLLPYLGILRTSFVVGALNLGVGLLNVYLFKSQLRAVSQKMLFGWASLSLMVLGFVYSFQISGLLEQMVYSDDIVFSKQSPYQRIVVTKYNNDTRLYINGNLQFSTIDEYRYHEPLVHVPMAFVSNPERILLLGAGDGLAVRELIKYAEIGEIDLVDLDPAVTQIATENPLFTRVNQGALQHPNVHIIHADAFNYVKETKITYDLVIIDLPDPNSPSLGKLYSRTFYRMLRQILTPTAVIITQSTSPFFARNAFWCIEQTLGSVFPVVVPMNVYLPTFGMWGFNMAFTSPQPELMNDAGLLHEAIETKVRQHLQKNEARLQNRFLVSEILPQLFIFEPDMQRPPSIETNSLNNQVLVRYYEESWRQWD